ncbi:MAG: site-specific integrase [Pseudomonadota bacterium]
MAAIRKVRDKWLAEVRSKGFYKSKTFYSKIEAQSWSVDVERQIGKREGMPTTYTLADAFKKYADEVSPSKKGARWEIIRLKHMAKYPVSDVRLEVLRAQDIQNWIECRVNEVSNSTVNREVNLISAVVTTARKKWKWHSGDPMKDIERPKNPPPRNRRISDVEISKTLESLNYKEDAPIITKTQQIAVAFLFALETAMRQGEIFGMMWENIYLDKFFVYLPDTKNGTSRDVPLSRRAVALLHKLHPDREGPVFTIRKATASALFLRNIKEAEIKNLTFHDTRHEALTRLARKIDVLDLARMVGHNDPRSLMIYYNPTATEIAERLG